MPSMTWSYLYNVGINVGTQAFGSFADNPGTVVTTTVQVTDPDLNVVQNTYGTHYGVNDGLLLNANVISSAGSTLRTTAYAYCPYNYGPYPTVVGGSASNGDEMSTFYTPQDSRIITQQGINFSQSVSCIAPGNTEFDQFARPLQVVKSSGLGYSNAEATTYFDDMTSTWVLGQVATVSVNGIQASNTTYYTGSDLPHQKYTFQKLVATYAFNADGTLYTASDGIGNTTTYSNYKRGLAQNISYADTSTQSAVVNNIGTIASVTSQSVLSPATYYTWQYDYDAMGRLWHAYPPTGDPVSYNAKVYSFVQVGTAEYGIPAGHWRQTITQGNAVTINYFDARWRKLLTTSYDSTNVSGTERMQLFDYDEYNRTTYASYPARSISSYDPSTLPPGTYTYYDALGRPMDVLADSELGTLTTGFQYLTGFQKQVTDPRGYSTTTTGFQAFDEPSESAPVAISLPESVSVSISRDAFGKPLSITRSGTYNGSGVSATRSYVFDANQRLCKTIEPETGATIQTLDAADNVHWKAIGLNLLSTTTCDTASVPANKQIAYAYDPRNRLTGIGYGDGSPSIGRGYWADGLLGSVVSNGSTWTYGYNNHRLLTTEQIVYAGLTGTATHSYDANAHETQLQYPDNAIVTYAPDALGEPTQVSGYTKSGTTVTYQPNGAIAAYTLANNIAHSQTQNTRLLPLVNQDAGILQDQYAYDADGDITGITDLQAGVTTRSMSYDGLDRMITANDTGVWGKRHVRL